MTIARKAARTPVSGARRGCGEFALGHVARDFEDKVETHHGGRYVRMTNCDAATALQIMKQTIRELADSGAISIHNEADPAAFFGFRPQDVAKVHFRKHGVAGVWFRLNDGRVFNRYGGIDDSDPVLYEQARD